MRTAHLTCLFAAWIGCGGDKKPSPPTVIISSPDGWRHRSMTLDGHLATFDIDYAKFAKKNERQEISPPLAADIKTFEGRPIELIISPTPCGDVKVPAKLKVTSDEAKMRAANSSVWTEVVVDRKPPTSSRVYIDAPGAKEVRIGKHVVALEDGKSVRFPEVLELECAPFEIAIDGTPLAIKLVDGTIEGVDIDAAKVENEKHEFIVVQPQTAAYLITTREGACYREIKQGYGTTEGKVERTVAGGNVYKLAWASFDHVLQPLPDNVSVTVTSNAQAQSAGSQLKAIHAVECPAPSSEKPSDK